MPPRLALLLGTILAALSLTRCDHQVRYRQLPFWVHQHFQKLSDWQYPQKIEVDRYQRKVYWLNKQGEIWSIGTNGKNEIVVNQGIGAQVGITFISDFTIDDCSGILYFTDLMDIGTGQGALKKSDLNGNHTQVIATFPDEVPYAVHWDEPDNQLYYATRQKNSQLHSLRQLGKNFSLMTTTQKVKNIAAIVNLPSSLHYQSPLMADYQLTDTKK
ncbi:hypothetical protein [Tunicatimonas pelagia]|uniref:hypothetical protein n=1 Tax=Tunicatimonas pelagia TaxID=931531 RepID=UPI002666795E|nr:hypothetical protein [Tunicatimonas pelagia]WKN41602.1 hypothetical protein P0M28_21435 [Tunicatimonas pelagia]